MKSKIVQNSHVQIVYYPFWTAILSLHLLYFSRVLSKDELIASLQRCVDILQVVKSKKMKKALVQLKELLAKFMQLDSK